MEQRMRQLVEMLNKYAHAYYVLDDPQISDGQYDELYDELLKLEKTTGIVLPDSPTNRVGGGAAFRFCAAYPSFPTVEFGQMQNARGASRMGTAYKKAVGAAGR